MEKFGTKKHVRSREDVLHGVFQAKSSDSDGRRRKPRKSKVVVDLTKPVKFVSAGTAMPEKEVDKNSKEEKNRDDVMFEEEEEEDYDGGRADLGFGSGLGFNSGFTGTSNGVGRGEEGAERDGNVIDEDELLELVRRIITGRKEKKEEGEGRGGGKMEEEIMGVMRHIEEQKSLGSLTLDDLHKCFSKLQMKFPDEYTLRKLSSTAFEFALPLFIRVFQGWDPLRNPMHGVKLMESWRTLLQGYESYYISDDGTPYAQLVSEVVLPAVQITCSDTWESRDPKPMLRFMKSWKELLPASVTRSILDDMVLPKLSAAVDSWDPWCNETVAIPDWVHPWLLPQLGMKKFEALHRAVLTKLRKVLDERHPSDASVYAILSPWRFVLDPVSWENLMRECILPELQVALEGFQILPAVQNLDQLNWVMSWASALPTHLMADLMERFFFVQWLQVLRDWLVHNPNMQEVHKWYLGWDDLLPPELRWHENIRRRFSQADGMISRVMHLRLNHLLMLRQYNPL